MTCPGCEGHGSVDRDENRPCATCNGSGVITKEQDDKIAMISRLTSDLERCHKESVKLIGILLDVAYAVGQKKESNYSTIRALKGWAKEQVEAMKLKSMQGGK